MMKDNVNKLAELQKEHDALSESYETLWIEYSALKEELEIVRGQYGSGSPSRSISPRLRESDESCGEITDSLLFDIPLNSGLLFP
jgi:predicted nuclease with TOPRIM domain